LPANLRLFGSVVLLSCLLAFAQEPSEPAAPAQLPTVELPAELQRVLTDYEIAWQNRDPAALAKLFAEDGFVLPNGRPPVRGRKEIERFYTGRGGPLTLRAMAFASEGSVAFIVGGYASNKGDQDSGKFTLTLRKALDGRWMIFSDMDSGNARRPPVAEYARPR